MPTNKDRKALCSLGFRRRLIICMMNNIAQFGSDLKRGPISVRFPEHADCRMFCNVNKKDYKTDYILKPG